VRHFHEKLKEVEAIHLTYSWVKQAMQGGTSNSKHRESQMIEALKKEAGRGSKRLARLLGVQAHIVCLEVEVRRHGCELGAGGRHCARKTRA
jgi:transposase-like protein